MRDERCARPRHVRPPQRRVIVEIARDGGEREVASLGDALVEAIQNGADVWFGVRRVERPAPSRGTRQ